MTGTHKYTPAEIYGEAGLIYIRAPSKVDKKKNGQQKIKANSFPNHGLISQQRNYNENNGDYYALLMGREFKPGRWVLLLDFDNKEENGSKHGSIQGPVPENTLGWLSLPFLCRHLPAKTNYIKNNT